MRAKSPRSPNQKKILKSNPSRSRSVPNNGSPVSTRTISPKENDDPIAFDTSQIDTSCDFFINEITVRQFIQTQRKKELVNLVKSAKQAGNRFISSNLNSQVISNQFWSVWDNFRAQLDQDLSKQLSQNYSSLSKNLSNLRDTVLSIKTSKKNTNLQERTYQLVNQGNGIQENPGDISLLQAGFKQFQNDLVHDDAVNKSQTLNYKLTSTISQVLTQLRNIKDISGYRTKYSNQFDTDNIQLENVIPKNCQQQSDQVNITPKPQKTRSKKSQKQAPNLSKPNQITRSAVRPNHSKDWQAKEENENDNDVKTTPRSDSKKLKAVVSLSTDLKNTKIIKSNNENNDDTPKAQNQFPRTKRKINSTRRVVRKPIYFSGQLKALNPIHVQKKFLELESIELNALTELYLSKLPDENRSAYQQNYDLRKQRLDFNEQLYQLKLRSLNINQISQRAMLNSGNCNESMKTLNEQFSITSNENKTIQGKLNALKEQYETLERRHVLYLRQKYSANSGNDSANDINKKDSIQNDLYKVKNQYRSQMDQLFEQQKRWQETTVSNLKNQTDLEIFKCRTKAQRELESIESRKQSTDSEYAEIKSLLNKANSKNDNTIQYGTESLEIDEAEAILSDLAAQSNQLADQYEKIKTDSAKNEQKLIQKEKDDLNNSNVQLMKWILQIRKQSIDMDAKLRSLIIQYRIMEEKSNNQDLDVNASFTEAVEETKQNNQNLRKMINDINQELSELDIEAGGKEEEMSTEQRLQAIAKTLREKIE